MLILPQDIHHYSSILFQMSDVEMGGNTIFIDAGPGARTKPKSVGYSLFYLFII